MKYTKEELCLIWLDSFLGLKNIDKRNLYKLIKDSVEIKSVLSRGKDYIVNTLGENMYNTLYNSANGIYLKFLLENLEKKGVVCVTLESEDYPEFMKNIELSPIILYAKGNISLLKTEMFTIVGSRKSLPSALATARDYAKILSKSGFTIVSGIADGADVSALKGALEVSDNVVCVIAGGFDNVYPKANIGVFEEVAECGLVLSEFPPEIKPQPFMFPVRNRIFPCLSEGVLIVSGGVKSGTLYTAEYTLTYGRELFVIPYGVGVSSGAGCIEMLKNGGIVTDSPKVILDYFHKDTKKNELTLGDTEKAIIKEILNGNSHIDKMCESLKKEIYEITPILSALEIKGVIAKSGFNAYCITRNDLEDLCNL